MPGVPPSKLSAENPSSSINLEATESDKEKKLAESGNHTKAYEASRQKIAHLQTNLTEALMGDMEKEPSLSKNLVKAVTSNPTLLTSFVETSIVDIPLSETAAKPPIHYNQILDSVDKYRTELGATKEEARPLLVLN
jgi:hypothetical protein